MKTIKFENKKLKPSKIVCIGRNYVEHIKELENETPTQMVIFLKPNMAISDELFTCKDENLHFESELSFLVEKNKLVAVSFGLDLTKRLTQSYLKSKGLPWERAKAFENSAIFSEFVSFNSLQNLSLKLTINNKLAQHASVDLMIHKPLDILNEVREFCSFEDFDIIMSGTPCGVGEFKKDDIFEGFVYENEKLLIKKKWVAK